MMSDDGVFVPEIGTHVEGWNNLTKKDKEDLISDYKKQIEEKKYQLPKKGSSQTRVHLRHYILRLYDAFKEKGILKIHSTQRGVYYILRKKQGGRLDITGKGQKLQSKIDKMIREETGERLGGGQLPYKTIPREWLGIVASAKSTHMFRGRTIPIRHDNWMRLAEKGSDIILCEKEGMCDLLNVYSESYGVVFVNMAGFSAEYPENLGVYAYDNDGNVFLLTDMDSHGYTMKFNLPYTTRLGINPKTVKDLNIPLVDVTETYNLTKEQLTHWKGLKGKLNSQLYNWLRNHRVEIDSVLAYVTAEKFWEYLKAEMKKHKPERKLERSLEITKDDTLPVNVKETLDHLKGFFTKKSWSAIREHMSRCGYDEYTKNELIEVEEVESELCDEAIKTIKNNRTLCELIERVSKLIPNCKVCTKNKAIGLYSVKKEGKIVLENVPLCEECVERGKEKRLIDL
jgi:hypothetical protein